MKTSVLIFLAVAALGAALLCLRSSPTQPVGDASDSQSVPLEPKVVFQALGAQAVSSGRISRPELPTVARAVIALDRGAQRLHEDNTSFEWRVEFAQAFDWFCFVTDIDEHRRNRIMRMLALAQQAYGYIDDRGPDLFAPDKEHDRHLEWSSIYHARIVTAFEEELATFLTESEMKQWEYWMQTHLILKMPDVRPINIPDGTPNPFESPEFVSEPVDAPR